MTLKSIKAVEPLRMVPVGTPKLIQLLLQIKRPPTARLAVHPLSTSPLL